MEVLLLSLDPLESFLLQQLFLFLLLLSCRSSVVVPCLLEAPGRTERAEDGEGAKRSARPHNLIEAIQLKGEAWEE